MTEYNGWSSLPPRGKFEYLQGGIISDCTIFELGLGAMIFMRVPPEDVTRRREGGTMTITVI